MNVTFIFILICCFLTFKTSKEYLTQKIIIDRPVHTDLSNAGASDGFRVRSFGGLPFKCSDFNAAKADGMYSVNQCQCTKDEATVSYSNRTWLCIDNEDFREREDCGFYFPLENEDDPLSILSEGDEKALTLPSTNCSINATSSMYLDCGTWRPIDKRSLDSKFSLNHRIADFHTLKVHSENLSVFLNGRVIKLGLTCLPSSGDHEPCVMFKLRGSESCPLLWQGSIQATPAQYSVLQTSRTGTKELQIISTPPYKPTPTVTVSSTVSKVQIPPSFKTIQTVHALTTPGRTSISSRVKLSFIAAVSSPTSSVKISGSVVLRSSPASVGEEENTIWQREPKSILPSPNNLSSRSTNTAIMFSSVLGVSSYGINHTWSNGNQSKVAEKMTNPPASTMAKIILTGVIPGAIAGVLLIFFAILLLYLARKMGKIRVGADRRDGAEGEEHSFSEEATVHASEDNLSVYELVERGNTTDKNEHRNCPTSVLNPVYQKDEQIALRARAKTPGNVEVIYAKPFARLPGRSDPATALPSLNGNIDPLKSASGYQNLLAKNQDSGDNRVIYASRYAVPERPMQRPLRRGTGEDVKKEPNVKGSLSSITEDLPNAERKDRYMLRDISVEDMEIENLQTTENLFEEMCIRPSILVHENKTAVNRSCHDIRAENSTGDHLDAMAQSSKGAPTEGSNTERQSCSNQKASKVNQSSSRKKLQTYFKMTL